LFKNNYTVNPFRAALYELIFVSREDALFHYTLLLLDLLVGY
jgi:hypothetical protein